MEQLGGDAHPLGHLEPDPPEIDEVSAAPKPRRAFNQRRCMAGAHEPVGERGSRDACTNDENLHATRLIVTGTGRVIVLVIGE